MLIPSQIIMTYVRPSYWLPGLELIWGLMTGLMAMATSAKQVYVLRVFLGLCESSAWPGFMTLLSEWTLHPHVSQQLTSSSVLVYTNRTGQAHGLLPFVPRDGNIIRGLHAGLHLQHPGW